MGKALRINRGRRSVSGREAISIIDPCGSRLDEVKMEGDVMLTRMMSPDQCIVDRCRHLDEHAKCSSMICTTRQSTWLVHVSSGDCATCQGDLAL
jgi:hypothetical protein